MGIQIFGKAKCFDTKKAERFFKERKIKVQSIDLPRYGMSKKEYESVKRAVGGLESLIDQKSKLYETLFIAHLATTEAIETALLENPALFKTPIVRNGQKATVGYCPEVWEEWVKS